jgi:hypothetical protein
MITMMINIIIVDEEREEDFLVTYLTLIKLPVWILETTRSKKLRSMLC